MAERAFLARLEGGCQVPIAGHATLTGDRLSMTGLVADLQGKLFLSGKRWKDRRNRRKRSAWNWRQTAGTGRARHPRQFTNGTRLMKPGKVYLIGAGPGDPGLITVKGQACIRNADVVIYDYLAAPALLAHASPETEMIYVGKKGGTTPCPRAASTSSLSTRPARAWWWPA
jgi:hypothetical protein